MRKSMTTAPFIDAKTVRVGEQFIKENKPKLESMLSEVTALRLNIKWEIDKSQLVIYF